MFVLALLVHAVMLTQGLYWYQAVELLPAPSWIEVLPFMAVMGYGADLSHLSHARLGVEKQTMLVEALASNLSLWPYSCAPLCFIFVEQHRFGCSVLGNLSYVNEQWHHRPFGYLRNGAVTPNSVRAYFFWSAILRALARGCPPEPWGSRV